jgi:hypothetical protein
MAAYKTGQHYLVNRITGAVFQFRDRIAHFSDLEEHIADENGVLIKVGNRSQAVDKLNPTETPEKTEEKTAVAKTTPTKQPTMAPVSEK